MNVKRKWIIALSIVIFGLSIRNIANVYQLYVLHDEFGYWLNASHFAGYDWSGIAPMSPYYSYGYSFCLVPFFWLFSNPVVMYRAAIVLNAFFYVGSFLVSVGCARKIFPKLKNSVMTAICFFAALYCGNLLQTNIAWAEAELYFLFWLLVYTLLCYLEREKKAYLVFFAFELVYIYMIHQRTLGVVIAGFFTLLLMLLRRGRHDWKKILIVGGALAAGFFAAVLLKEYLHDNLWKWTNKGIAATNDYSGQFSKIKYILTTGEGIYKMVLSFTGKVFYLLVSSGGLVFWAILAGIMQLRKGFAEKRSYIVVFTGLSLIFSVGISAVMMVGGGRIDCTVYGRYSEFLIGILLVSGMYFMYEYKLRFVHLGIYAGLLLVGGIIVMYALKTGKTFTYIQSVGAGLFYDDVTGKFRLFAYVMFGLAIGTIGYWAGRWKKMWLYTFFLAVSVSYWWMSSQESLDKEVLIGQAYVKDAAYISQFIDGVDEDVPIFFVEDDNASFLNRRIENIQFLLRSRKIQLIEYEQLNELEGEYYLVQYGVENLDMARYEIATQAYGMVLMVPDNTELAEKCLAYNRENPYVFTETMMYSETKDKDFEFVSDYKRGFLVFAQDLTLSPGGYQVTMDIEVSEKPLTESIGSYDVSYNYGQDILCSAELWADEIDENGIAHIVIEFACTETLRHTEFRFYTHGDAEIQLKKLEYVRQK